MKLHANAALSLVGRRRLVEAIPLVGLAAAAEAAGVSPTTARKWWGRWVEAGEADLFDRSSRRTSQTAAEMRHERREARAAARQSGSEYVDPSPTRGLAHLPDLHYSAAFKAHGAHLAILAVAVALLTFCGLYWVSEVRRRREEDELRREQLAADLERQAEEERMRRIVRDEIDRSRGDEGPVFP